MYLKKKHLPSGRKEKNASNRRPVGLRPAGRFLSIFADCHFRQKIRWKRRRSADQGQHNISSYTISTIAWNGICKWLFTYGWRWDIFFCLKKKQFSYSTPLPTLRDVKRHFICNADRLIFADLLIRQIIGKAQDSNLCVSRYRHKTVKWILSALPFFFFLKLKNFQNCIPKQLCGFLLV